MKTKTAIKAFGNKSRLADALGIHRSAVTLWGEEVPPLRVYQLQEKFPDIFQSEPSPDNKQQVVKEPV